VSCCFRSWVGCDGEIVEVGGNLGLNVMAGRVFEGMIDKGLRFDINRYLFHTQSSQLRHSWFCRFISPVPS
jgi:hypothetical protein